MASAAPTFFWMMSFSRWIAPLIWSAPPACSLVEALISCTSSAVRRMSGTSWASIPPARSATSAVREESRLISPAAAWLRSASFRTSAATTAKPLPCSPARAASMAAFRASRFVWRAISPMIEIFPVISFRATMASETAFPLSTASAADLSAIFSVSRALSAFCRIVAFISSMEAEACSAEVACSVAPRDIWVAPCESSWLQAATWSETTRTSATTVLSFSSMFFIAARSWPVSSFEVTSIGAVRSPSASRFAACTARSRGRTITRRTE